MARPGAPRRAPGCIRVRRPAVPEEGVLSTRSPDRPNPIGLHRVEIVSIEGARVRVRNLEAIDGTPVIDVKPVLDRGSSADATARAASLDQQAELAGAVGGLDARAAVELAQDVADVHVDGARAEEELLRRSRGWCARRRRRRTTSSSRRVRPAPSASAAARLPSRWATDSPSSATSRAASAASGRAPSLRARAVGVAEPLQRHLALAGRGEGDAGPQLDLRSLVGDVQVAVQLDRARELLGRRLRVAVGQRRLADRLGERGERVGVPGRRRRSASAPRRRRARPRGRRGGRRSRPPSAGPRPRSGGPRSPPSARAARGRLGGLVVGALGGGDARQRRRRSTFML